MKDEVTVEQVEQVKNEKTGQGILFSLEEMTVKSVGTVQDLRDEIKQYRDMIEDGYLRNIAYQDQAKRVKEEQDKLAKVKIAIDVSGGNGELKMKLQSLMDELKEKTGSISEYILEISRITGEDSIDVDGVLYDIVKSARLVKRGK